MDQQEASKKLSELVKEAYQALRTAEAFADEHKLGFHFSAEYGMGGYYEGDDEAEDGSRWYPSSQSC